MASITKLKSGNYRVLLRSKGVYRSATFPSMAEARKYSALAESQVRSATYATTGLLPMPDVTVAEAIAKHIEVCEKNNVSIGRTKRATLNAWSVSNVGKVKLPKLTRIQLTDYCDKRLESGVCGASVAGDLSVLSSMWKWFRSQGFDCELDKLCSSVRSSLSARGVHTRSTMRERIPTAEELEAIVTCIENKPLNRLPIRRIVYFAASSAMRAAEIGRLCFGDINHGQQAVLVRARKHPDALKKLANNQLVPMPSAAWQIILDICAERAGALPTDKVFDCRIDSALAAWQRAVRKLGLSDLHFHDCRHLALTSAASIGLSNQILRLLSGHRSSQMLDRYVNLGPSVFHAAVAKATADGKV